MQSNSPRFPAPVHHKASEQDVLFLRDESGKRRMVYLGKHGSPEAARRYREVLAAHLAGKRPQVSTRSAILRRLADPGARPQRRSRHAPSHGSRTKSPTRSNARGPRCRAALRYGPAARGAGELGHGASSPSWRTSSSSMRFYSSRTQIASSDCRCEACAARSGAGPASPKEKERALAARGSADCRPASPNERIAESAVLAMCADFQHELAETALVHPPAPARHSSTSDPVRSRLIAPRRK